MAELNSLDNPAQKPVSSMPKALDDLDSLMATLNNQPSKQPRTSSKSSTTGLDGLMADLNAAAAKATPATTPSPKSNPSLPTRRLSARKSNPLGEDLVGLMAELDAVVTPKPNPGAAPPKSSANPEDQDELSALLADLTAVAATPSAKSQPAPAPAATPTTSTTKTVPANPSPRHDPDGDCAVSPQKPATQTKPVAQSQKATPPPVVDDLDALMASLSTSKSTQPTPTNKAPAVSPSDPLEDLLCQLKPSAPKKTQPPAKEDDLEDLLTKLNGQPFVLDSDSPSRGTCFFCNGPIMGEIIQALSKTYHPEHFRCGSCNTPLGTATFYEHEGKPNCEKCYTTLLCPRCAHCDQPILDKCITALGKKWHINHFVCAVCNNPFPNGTFYEKDGKPFCENDYAITYAAKCAGCNKAITGDCLNALGQKWHPDHFVCNYCHRPFPGGAFYEYQSKAYCEPHYYQMTGYVCSGCGKPVTGRVLTALDKKWHPEHFMCAFCMAPLAGGLFKEEKGKAYCGGCYQKLFC
ncbi:focal contact protein paxillin [Pelomyxa schiedti]|nr:focal contact protein paxillin [Pelomyxa schiedti]